MANGADLMEQKPEGYPTATYGGGCFWCLESEFRAMDGVLFTAVGYMGGDLENPTYRDITTGKTGHAEVVEVTFDPDKISFETLTEFFLREAHDPTQLNRQGVDVGTQYRSEIFYHDESQKDDAQAVVDRLNSGDFGGNIVTKLSKAQTFWMGEDYHQQYYEKYEEQTGKPHLRVILKQKKKALKNAVGLD
ncbi:MAG: peptide-methionine (S)-S-oxide reductase MsrA [Pseudomonadota bacterium]